MGADSNGGVFGNNMHYVMADGLDKKGNVLIKDPLKKNIKSYPMQQILGGSKTAKYGTGDDTAESADGGVLGGIAGMFDSFDTMLSNAVSRAFGIEVNAPSASGSQGSSSGYVSGDDNPSKAWNFLKSKGFSDAAIAGVLGNLEAESGINPKNLENSYERKLGHTDDTYTRAVDTGAYKTFNSDRAGYGLAQWTSAGRKKGLYDLAKSRGTSVSDIGTQLEWLYQEFIGRGLGDKLIKTNSVKDMSTWMLQKFEIPKDYKKQYMVDKRYNLSQKWYDKFAGGKAGGSGTYNSSYGGLDDFFLKNIPGAKKTQSYKAVAHPGLDFGAPAGSTIRTPVAGSVALNQFNNSYGNYIKVKDGKGNNHTFAHMLKPSPLPVGQTVRVGDVVGQVGSTGNSTGNHLHYDIWSGNKRIDPYAYFTNGMGPGLGANALATGAKGINYKIGNGYGNNAISQMAKTSNYRILRSNQDAQSDMTMGLLSSKLDRVAASAQESTVITQLTAVMGEMLVVLKNIETNTGKPAIVAKSDTYNDNRQTPSVPTARPEAARTSISAGTYMIDQLTSKV